MANREKIALGECYHVYNRGVDKRSITKDKVDAERFMQSLEFFNSKDPIISLREVVSSENDKNIKSKEPLVEIVCYCLNPNHYHLLLREIYEGGISEFMKRLGGGYTWYFNNKHKRSGALFQGRFKSVHIKSNEQLLHDSAYVNLNWKVHNISGSTAERVRSSWDEYIGKASRNICSKDVILGQFRSKKDYKIFAESSLKEILKAKNDKKGEEMIIGKHFY
ncbi:MAG: transposase [Candidatus Pacebacteria bacterium]|nr:transposase [Candidatus Paceibacterota bacterium]